LAACIIVSLTNAVLPAAISTCRLTGAYPHSSIDTT
jgi:hypothetical protein